MAGNDDYIYPDVLQFITGRNGYCIGPVEAALAMRPRIVRAGRPFEAILLVQNTLDVPVDVKVRLQLPEKDTKGNKGRFLHGGERLAVTVPGAEVGYVLMPLSTLPNTAPGDDYPIGVDVSAEPLEKGKPIRAPGTEAPLNPKTLPDDKRRITFDLYNLKYSVEKRGGFLRGGSGLETGVNILPGKVGKPINLQPGWHSLWNLHDQQDMDLLLAKYREVLKLRFMPGLNRNKLFPQLLERVTAMFERARYPLLEFEAICVAKLMMLIIEFATASASSQAMAEAGRFNIESHLNGTAFASSNEVKLPRWFETILQATARDERVASVPVKATMHYAFEPLLFDAMIHAFEQIERYTGEDLGTPEEMELYAESIIESLKSGKGVDFSSAYMPMVIGGIISYDRIMLKTEVMSDVLENLKHLLTERGGDRNESNELIFDLAKIVIDQSLRKYGSLGNRI